jgi:hypothetical protein
MGYITRFSGELAIEPPLTWAEIRDSDFSPDHFEANRLDVKIRVEEVTVDTVEGQMIRRSGGALIPAYEDEMRGYDIVEHVQRFIDTYGPAHSLTGRFDCEGEEAGDIWRLVVHDGRAVKVTPRIVWPDGTEEVGG